MGLIFLPGEGRLWWFLKYEKVVVIETGKLPNVQLFQNVGDSQIILKLLRNHMFFFGSQTQTMVSCEHFDATKNRLRQTKCEENLLSKQFFASIKRNMTISLREKITFEKKNKSYSRNKWQIL